MATLTVAPPQIKGVSGSSSPGTVDLVGPVSTQSGFQYWYLVCSSDAIIAVRQSISAFFMFGLSNGAAPAAFGLLGGLLNLLVTGRSKKYREKTEANLRRARKTSLQAKPNITYQVAQLKSISFKDVKNGGNLILPHIVLETMSGKQQKYRIQKTDFDKACEVLKQQYPHLCR